MLKRLSLATSLCLFIAPASAQSFDPSAPMSPSVEINFSLLDQIETMPRETLQPYKSASAASAPVAEPAAPAATTAASSYTPPKPVPVREAMPELFGQPQLPTIEELNQAQETAQPEQKISKKEALSMDIAPEIKVISAAPPPFNLWQADWSGLANIGTSFKKGNGENKRVDLDATTKAVWENKDRLGFSAYYKYEDDNDIETVDERGFSTYFDDFIDEKLFINYNGRIENDDIAGVDLRSVIGIGLGHQLFDTESLKVSYSLGPSYLIEETKIVTGDETEKALSYNWKFDLEKHLKNDMAVLYHNHTWLAPANETGDFVFDSHTGARIPLRDKLVASIDIEHDIDQSAEAGVSESDTKYSLKLGYEW